MGCCASRKEHAAPQSNISFHQKCQQGQQSDQPGKAVAAAQNQLSPTKMTKPKPKCNQDRKVQDQIYSLQEPAIIRISPPKGNPNLRRANMRSTLSITIHEERQPFNPEERRISVEKSSKSCDVLSNKGESRQTDGKPVDSNDHLKVRNSHHEPHSPPSPLHIRISHEYEEQYRSEHSAKYTQVNGIKFDLAIRLSPIKMQNGKLYGDDLSITSNSIHGVRGFRNTGFDLEVTPVELEA